MTTTLSGNTETIGLDEVAVKGGSTLRTGFCRRPEFDRARLASGIGELRAYPGLRDRLTETFE